MEGDTSRIKELENENMQLKIDVGVRKQLLERAKEEMDEMRTLSHNLLRENGTLQYQIGLLAAPPTPTREVVREQPPAVPPQSSAGEAPIETYPHKAGGATQ